MDWTDAIQKAIDYVEAHLTEPLDFDDIAGESCYSSFHFQRVFSILCGYTLGEYVRNRRLSAAGAELAEGRTRVIDAAYKYGYESPDSFARAFRQFHGITPSQARSAGASLRTFLPLTIRISFEGGSIMDYRIENKPGMLLTGFKRRFTGDPNDKQYQDHYFACETRLEQYVLEGMSREHEITYQILTNYGDDGYDFYFASKLPKWALDDFEEDLGEFAGRFEHVGVPEGLYVVCETDKCEFPTNLVDELRRRIVCEWLPMSGYELREAPEIDVIHWFWEEGNDEVNSSRYCEMWLPIVKKK